MTVGVVREYSRRTRLGIARTAARVYLAPKRRILFYPKYPSPNQVLYKVCAFLAYSSTSRLGEPCDLAIHFQPTTHADPAVLADLTKVPVVINRFCTDISKTRVQEAFADIFGYPLAVDPTRYQGLMVEKSDENFRHDGKLLEGPLQPTAIRQGSVYQRAVRNEDGQGCVVDLRVPVYDGSIPFTYIKRRKLDDRFGSKYVSAVIAEPREIFSEKEMTGLARLALALGADYAEMDVLRDNEDGRIYVVDVNNTPSGPAKVLTPEDRIIAMERLSPAFEVLIDTALAGKLRTQQQRM